MSTSRFYFPASGSAAVSPAFGGMWEHTADAVRRPLEPSPSNTTAATASVTKTTAADPGDVLTAQHVGPNTLTAGELSGTFSLVIKCAENTASANAFLQCRILVVSGDGATVRGELYSGQTSTVASAVSTDPDYEFNTNTGSPFTRILEDVPLTPVTAQAGDRLVVEIGYRSCNVGTTRVGSLGVGDQTSDTDLALTVDLQTANSRPWIEFTLDDIAVPPDTPTIVLADPGPTSIDLDWIAAGTGGAADGFNVRIDGGAITDAGDVLTYTFTGTYPGSTYVLEVQAYNAAGVSGWAGVEVSVPDPVEGVFTAEITLGDHVWTITSDACDFEDPVQVLDSLRIGWESNESDPWPAQPGPVSCSLGLWTADVAELVDVAIGTPLSVVLTDVLGNTFATFHGRVASQSARPRKDGPGVLSMFYSLTGMDYTVDLAETPVTIVNDWPAESAVDRILRVVGVINAAGAPIDLNPPSDYGDGAFAALEAQTTTAAELLERHLSQLAIDNGDGPQRYIVVPVVNPDLSSLDKFAIVLLERKVDAALLPGVVDVVGGELVVTFPDMDADGLVDACIVDLDVTWTRTKFRAVNVVTVSAEGVTAAASTSESPPVRLNLDSDLTVYAAALRMAQLYLPDAGETYGWTPDVFTLYSHRRPATITPAWFPDHREDAPVSTAVYVMPIAVVGIPENVNLSGETAYAGQLVKVELTLAKKRALVDFGLRRQLPASDGADAVTWDWITANHPTLTWDDCMGVSWHDVRLGRIP